MVGLVASVVVWVVNGDVTFLVAGLLLGSVIPFTLIAILPTNKRLLNPSLDASSAEAGTLLKRWGRLHLVRAVAGLLVFVLLALALIG